METDFDFYSYDAIDKIPATYKIIMGQRSNGKTYGWCRKVLCEYLKSGLPSAYIRRLDKQIEVKMLGNLFSPHTEWVEKESKGKWNAFVYRSHAFYLARYETLENGQVKKMAQDKTAFCHTYALNTAETSKGADNGRVSSVCFDEFMTRAYYLQNEFVLFQNVLSSILRGRSGATIYMLANTVNKYCPYFKDMGLSRVSTQKQGTIDTYKMGKSNLKIAVEYCSMMDMSSTKAAEYYAFDNPQLKMITDGSWEIALYRHAPPELSSYRVIYTFFILFDEKIVQGDIHMYKGYPIIFFHEKTTPIKDFDRVVVYVQDTMDGNPLHQIDLRVAPTKAQKIILDLLHHQKTFFADNQTGEIVNNWLKFTLQTRTRAYI